VIVTRSFTTSGEYIKQWRDFSAILIGTTGTTNDEIETEYLFYTGCDVRRIVKERPNYNLLMNNC
jgi:hypothetical protein